MNSSNPQRKQWGAVLWLLVILVVPCCLCSGSAWLIAGRPWAYLVLAAFFAFCLIGAVRECEIRLVSAVLVDPAAAIRAEGREAPAKQDSQSR